MATDFCTIDCLPTTAGLAQDWRREGYDDVMQLPIVIWHAWSVLCSLAEDLASQPPNELQRAGKSRATLTGRLMRRRKASGSSLVQRDFFCPHDRCLKNISKRVSYAEKGLIEHM